MGHPGLRREVTLLSHYNAVPPQLPFSVIGSLNGVHMFGQNLDVQLTSARTEDTIVVWKSFHDRSLCDDPRVLCAVISCGIWDKSLTLSDPWFS